MHVGILFGGVNVSLFDLTVKFGNYFVAILILFLIFQSPICVLRFLSCFIYELYV